MIKFKHSTSIFTLLLSLYLFITSCNIINADETIPSYIYIQPFTFTTDLETQGFASSKITDGWVYLNDNPIGVFELPAQIPILASGDNEISILPGIKENGISGTAINYQFYQSYLVSINLEEKNIDTIYPTTNYIDDIDFELLDRFELGNPFLATSESDAAVTTTLDANVFEGLRSGAVYMEQPDYFFRCVTDDAFYFSPGKTVYLELDYKCDINFEIHLRANKIGFPLITSYVLTITKKDDWNKIYVNLTPQIQFLDGDSYNLEIHAFLPSDQNNASLYFDNIKIIEQN
ncbi:MAG: hypothetical protein H0U27_02290 [Nitrosopumilus sp.]|nr:hypothetical protein [Nitrosopumilus sp.]